MLEDTRGIHGGGKGGGEGTWLNNDCTLAFTTVIYYPFLFNNHFSNSILPAKANSFCIPDKPEKLANPLTPRTCVPV